MSNSYNRAMEAEIAKYATVKNVHDLPEIYHYWSNKYLLPKMMALGVNGVDDFYFKYICSVITRKDDHASLLSIGAGNCDLEIRIMQRLIEEGYSHLIMDCVEINPEMLKRGKEQAEIQGIADHFRFLNYDVNKTRLSGTYSIVIANHSLHHIVKLEFLFKQIKNTLTDNGLFLINDMIGRNGHMRWPESEYLVRGFWNFLEERHKYNHQLQRLEPDFVNWDCSKEGFEGIRAQDILPLLISQFHFKLFLGFSNLISVFIDRSFGHNFKTDNPKDTFIIDMINSLDDFYLSEGSIKPTQMIAAVGKSPYSERIFYKNLTPEFCVRRPGPQFVAKTKKIKNKLVSRLKRLILSFSSK
jgi:SAM-dependent methyltransferase